MMIRATMTLNHWLIFVLSHLAPSTKSLKRNRHRRVHEHSPIKRAFGTRQKLSIISDQHKMSRAHTDVAPQLANTVSLLAQPTRTTARGANDAVTASPASRFRAFWPCQSVL